MAKLSIKAGTTSKTLKIFVQDSSVTTGAGLTGLTNASGSLTGYYVREGANAAVSISIVSATLGTFTSGGFIVVDGTNMPGLYEIGIPDAAIAAGANSVVVMYKGAANMAPVVLEIELTAYDPYDGVRLGLTALPNAAAGAAGGLWILGANAAANTTLTGTAASGATPATSALTLTGGAASTTGGGTASPALKATGGAGAASTNGAAAGVTVAGGGTNTVASAADGLTVTGASNGAGLQVTGAGTGNGLGLTAVGTGKPNTPVQTSYAIVKNTAFTNFAFTLVSSTDHVTPKTGVTVTAQRSIDGGALAACANAVTEVGGGIYKINLANTDLNGNCIILSFTGTGADPRIFEIVTQS